jgi:hypothetical protein
MLKLSFVSGLFVIAYSLDAAWFHGKFANAALGVGRGIAHFLLRF